MNRITIFPEHHHAVIFDLDGVVTKTAGAHATTWKQLFDEYLQQRDGASFKPFDAKADYTQYVDGKPRYEGIQSFLESRGIEIPWGEPEDSLDRETICGLGNRKNLLFQEHLRKHGVEVYESTVDLIKALKQQKVKVGIISSSKNCTPILEKTGLLSLFDVKIDGVDASRLQIKGKPEPDVFLEAAKMLGVSPRETVVVEDAISGVQAGSRGKFTLVIGVDRANQAEALKENGADIVVKDLSEARVAEPNAIEAIAQIEHTIKGKKVAIFLDFDGTLSPIVSHPDDACFADGMAETLEKLGHLCTIAIISGRDRQDVEKRAHIGDVFYAGSHGFDITGPNNQHYENEEAGKFLPIIEQAAKDLQEQLKGIQGALVEHKRYSVAIHYRQVSDDQVDAIKAAVDCTHKRFPTLRQTSGKKIYELQPDVNWDKGKALLWLLGILDLDKPDVLPFYLGDDTTDEDAFAVLVDRGVGIAVHDQSKPTSAHYVLKDPDQVQQFLELLMSRLQHG